MEQHQAVSKHKFSIGDRVVRPRDVYNPKSPIRHGTVARVYQARNQFGYYPELYAVDWDDGKHEEGFLPHGLDIERSS